VLRFGSTKGPVVADFVRDLLREVEKKVSLSDVVLVYDNASVHNSVKEVVRESEFVVVQAIPLSPYSPMLNPIENTFSVFKSAVKMFLGDHRDRILTVPAGTTKTAHRASWLRAAAEYSMPAKITPELCKKFCRHTLRFHVPALNMLSAREPIW
jgi:transposase